MPFSFLVSSALLLGSGPAQADTGEPDEGNAQTEAVVSKEEITIYGEAEVLRRRGEVIQTLRHLGYREGRRKNGRTVMVPKTPYKPSVVLDDDGWMQVKRSPIRFDPPGDSNWRYLWCLPPFTITPTCIQVGGQVIGRRKLGHFKEDVVRATRYGMHEWQDAVIALAMDQRLGTEIPDMLDATWTTGTPFGIEGPTLESHEKRRAAILRFWSSRSCLPEGAAVRDVVATFVEAEIQMSDHPASAEEIAAANEAQRCYDAQLFTIE